MIIKPISEEYKEKRRGVWRRVIYTTNIPAVAYNGFFGWEKLDEESYGLTLRGVFVGLWQRVSKYRFCISK